MVPVDSTTGGTLSGPLTCPLVASRTLSTATLPGCGSAWKKPKRSTWVLGVRIYNLGFGVPSAGGRVGSLEFGVLG